jgi:uncharacterized protein (TIRG00374 family)
VKQVWRGIAISLILSVAAILFVILREGRGLDPAAVAGLIKPNALGFLLLIATLLGWWIAAGLRVQLLAGDMGGRVTLSRATRAYLLGLFSACVTPAASGSSLAMGWYLSRYLDARQAAGLVIYTVVLDLVFYVWALPVAFLVLDLGGVNLGVPLLGVYVAAFAVFFAFLAWMLAFRVGSLAAITWRLFSLRLLRRFRRSAFASVVRTGRVLADFRRLSVGRQIALHGSTAILYLLHFAAFNAVTLALGLQVNHLNIIALQVLIVAMSFVAPTPGGSGYFEVALGIALTGQVPEQAKVFLIIVWRIVSYWLYFIIGPAIGGLALLRATEASRKAQRVADAN